MTDELCTAMASLGKRSFVEAFLDDASKEEKKSVKTTRLELAKAKNRRDTCYQNMLKGRQRLQALLERVREHEAAHHAAVADVDRLQALLTGDT